MRTLSETNALVLEHIPEIDACIHALEAIIPIMPEVDEVRRKLHGAIDLLYDTKEWETRLKW